MADIEKEKLNSVSGHEEHEHCGCGCGHDHEHDHHHEHEEHAHHHHDHDHGDSCGCGHDHEHEDHAHHHHDHEHGDSCGCGHDHEHEHHHHDHEHEEHEHHHHDHDHGDSCGCGHDHGHEHSANARREVYIVENLGCAHCASKMEEKINALPGVEEATITFATKQLRVLAADPDALLPEMQRICSSVEAEVKLVPKTVNASAQTKVYIIDGLDCAHCAAKVEERINQVPGVEKALLTYATKQLRITAENPDALIDEIRRVSTALEPEVTIAERDPSPKSVARDAAAQSAREEEKKKERKELISIIIGAVLFVVGEILSHTGAAAAVTLPVFVIGYLILGAGVLVTAAKNISHGQVFDENFLMSIATLGAFAIGMYPEAMGVMLFYRIGEFFEHKAVERSRGQIMDAVDVRLRSGYRDETYKHIMLPIYATAYTYKGKKYHVLINGQSGRVEGDYPKSPAKIIGIILGIVLILVIVYLLSGGSRAAYLTAESRLPEITVAEMTVQEDSAVSIQEENKEAVSWDYSADSLPM